jgi:hypothetical protein
MGVVWILLLVPERQAVAVPVEDLDPVAPPIPEHEEVSRERILVDPVADELAQAVEALAHVGGFDSEKDTECRDEAQHGRPSSTATTRRKVSESNPGPITTRRPGSITITITTPERSDASPPATA